MDLNDRKNRQIAAILARESLYFFSRWMFRQNGKKWQRNWHHDAICAALERVFRGEIDRLIINVPPRYSKTEIAVVNFIAWCLGQAPDAEFIHASYAARLAAANTWRTRNLVTTEAYREIFPRVVLQADKSAQADWHTSEGGVVYAAGAGGSITGFGAGKMREGFGGALIIDDPHKPDEATSDVIRQGVIDWYQNTIESRLNSPDTPIIVIMQRLHEKDLAGWLLGGGTGEKWEHVCLPARNDAGEALWPEKHDDAALKRLEATSPYVFAGQYMQRPAPLGGGIFKTAWWKYFKPAALPKVRRIIQSWDTAFKAKETADYSVCTTWAECEPGYFLLDVYKDKVEFPVLKRMLVSLAEKHKPHAILVEDKASGQSLIQEIRRETTLPVVAIKVDSDKVSRAIAVTPLIESGRVFLPEGAPWLVEYTGSLAAFPNAAHDDDVDSTTQALNYLARGGGNLGLFEFMREQVEEMEANKNG